MEIQLNDTMKLPSGKERSMFDTAIPGQSLTKTPNIYHWDKPHGFCTVATCGYYY